MGSINHNQSLHQDNDTNGDIDSNIADWCNKFDKLWERSDQLFSLLRSSDDYYQRPIKLRLPLIFYVGHLPCFSWAQFQYLDGVNKVIHVVYDKLFQRGVDPNVLTGIVNHGHSSRYSIDDDDEEKKYWQTFTVECVNEYKVKVRSEIKTVLTNGKLNFNDVHTLNVLNISLEHEMMHQETLMYIFAQLPIQALRLDIVKEQNLRLSHATLPLSGNTWIQLPGGRTSLGKPYDETTSTYSFGWDNEFPSEPTYVSSFEMQSHPVCIGDFLEFVLDNGYKKQEWWDDNDFQWITETNMHHPTLWSYDNSYRVNFILQRDVPIESVLDHPVIVSHIEAKAYCRWLSKKVGQTIDLPTEVEWIYAMWDWSKCIPTALADGDHNVDFRHLHTIPINTCNKKNLQWQGSAFEWTSSLFRPFLNYQGNLPTYPGYSSDFFDDLHFVLLGGSFATDIKLIRRTFRNWYQDKYRYAFATFRCVKRNGHTDHPLSADDQAGIISGLGNASHRTVPSQYFYDAHGSALYEQITQLDEYYLYNQELKLLQNRAGDIRNTIIQHSKDLSDSTASFKIHFIELGCGDGSKVETWLRPWVKSEDNVSVVYHPVDISQHAIDSLVRCLSETFGEEIVKDHVKPICSTFDDMYQQLDINSMQVQVVMLLGSTIGNFCSFDSNRVKFSEESPVINLFQSVRSNLKKGDWFLCAFDLCKNTTKMIQAYSDSKGITSAFNLNLLHRLNREMNFNFKVTNFQHYATFNPLLRQMESWLLSTKHQHITNQNGFSFDLQPYDAIQTEVSVKYTHEDIKYLMAKHSLKIVECYVTNDYHLPYALCMAQAI